jgi:predicted transcriptional regulator
MNAYCHDYPDEPGHRGVDTSIEAAASISHATGRIQRMVYHAVGEVGARGLTCEELAERLRMERTTVQPRTSELKLLGLIEDSGERRRNRNGKRAIVWVTCRREARNG